MTTRMIGLAGRPGCGKSAVAGVLAAAPGVEAIDLDRIAWETYVPGTPTHRRLAARFGREVLTEEGRIDRARLAERSLSDPGSRNDLASIIHPAVCDRLAELKRDAENRAVGILLVEGALLACSPYVDRSTFDAIVWLEASDETRRARLRADGREEHADRMSEAGPTPAEIVIDAEGSLSDVAERVRRAIGR